MNSSTVCVIVVTYNSAQVIRLCLDALLHQTYPTAYYEIHVVDNASSDNTVSLIRTHYPTLIVHANDKNAGFAAANNQVMRQAETEFIALVNPDVELDPGWLATTITCMDEEPEAGVIGSKVIYSNRIVLQHAGGLVGPNALSKHVGDGEFDIGQYEQITDVDYVIGAAILIRRTVAERLNYLDERYFMYYEETDLCIRMRALGHRVLYCPQAVAIHYDSHSLSA